MKKNKMMRLASLLLVCVLLTTSVISGTFAKYVSEASVTDTARVAVWDIELDLGDGAAQMPYFTDTVSVDLFSTAYASDTDGVDGNTVVSANTDKVIAPGTKGSFSFSIQNKSEVTAKYQLEYALTKSADIPIEFSTDETTWSTNIADLDVDFTNLAIGSDAVNVTVYWRWQFENGISTDEADTALGLLGTDTVVVDVSIIAEQVD